MGSTISCIVFVVPRRIFGCREDKLPVRRIVYLRDLRVYGVQGSNTAEVRGEVATVGELRREFARMPHWPTSYREIVNASWVPQCIVESVVDVYSDPESNSRVAVQPSTLWYDVLRIVLQNRSDDIELVDLLCIGAVCRTWNHAVQDSPQAWGPFVCASYEEIALTDWRAASLSTRFIPWASDPRRVVAAIMHTMPYVHRLITHMGRGSYNKIAEAMVKADPADAVACVAETYCYGALEQCRFAEGIDILQKGAVWGAF